MKMKWNEKWKIAKSLKIVKQNSVFNKTKINNYIYFPNNREKGL